MSDSVKEPSVESLLKQLEEEKRKTASLERNNAELKRKMGIQQSQIEAEAERITNKLMLRIEEIEKEKAAMRLQVEAEERRLEHEKKELETKLQQSAAHLARLKHEKEALVRQVEQEEEFLTNTLQHKLAKVLAEKVEIENELEQEQEYISNRLQKQVVDTLKEKQEMERRLDEEKAKVQSMEEEKKKLARQLQSLQLNIEVEEERISNTLGKTVDQIKSEKEALIQKLEKEKAVASALSREHELQRMELKKLQGTNYVMQQRIAKESKRLTEMQREKSLIAQRLEAEWERHFNMMIRERTCYPAFNRASSLEKWNLAEMEAVDFCDNSWNSVDPDGDVLGELCLTPRNFREKRRSGKWESQSLPSFSPRLSPYPSPPATPYSSRSRSPAMNRSRDITPTGSRSQSPSARSSHSSIVSAAETAGHISFPTKMTGSLHRLTTNPLVTTFPQHP